MAPITRSISKVQAQKSTLAKSQRCLKNGLGTTIKPDSQIPSTPVPEGVRRNSRAKEDPRPSISVAVKVHPPPPERFPLLSLPRELVDIVYRHLIQTGNLAILRTSRTVNGQAAQLIRKYGIFRITTPQYLHQRDLISLSGHTFEMIQNVEVELELFSTYMLSFPSRKFEPITYFTGQKIPRKTCRIIMRINFSADFGVDSAIIALLRRLRGFETVITEFQGYFSSQLPGLGDYSVTDQSHGLMASSNVKSIYKRVQKALEPSLGLAIWCESGVVGARQLEFYPTRFIQAEASANMIQ